MKALTASPYLSFTFLALLGPWSEWDPELMATGEMEMLVGFCRRGRGDVAGNIECQLLKHL